MVKYKQKDRETETEREKEMNRRKGFRKKKINLLSIQIAFLVIPFSHQLSIFVVVVFLLTIFDTRLSIV